MELTVTPPRNSGNSYPRIKRGLCRVGVVVETKYQRSGTGIKESGNEVEAPPDPNRLEKALKRRRRLQTPEYRRHREMIEGEGPGACRKEGVDVVTR